MKNTKIIELAKKLQALSIKGVGGEKDNAQKQLKVLMEKYNLSEKDLEDETGELIYFRIKKSDKMLFLQVAASIIGNRIKDTRFSIRGPYKIWLKIKTEEKMKIKSKYQFYKRAYEEELEILNLAFFTKYNLLNKDNSHYESPPKLTPDEMEKHRRAWEMIEAMKDRSFFGQLKKRKY